MEDIPGFCFSDVEVVILGLRQVCLSSGSMIPKKEDALAALAGASPIWRCLEIRFRWFGSSHLRGSDNVQVPNADSFGV